MRTRSLGLTLFAGLSIFVAACSSGGASPSASAAAPATATSASPIRLCVAQGFTLIATVGFTLGAATTAAAHANPKITFIGVDQSPICVDEKGAPDPKFACKGNAAQLDPNYISIWFQED